VTDEWCATDDRWEHGSTFAMPDLASPNSRTAALPSALDSAHLVGSGRVALACLLEHGRRRHGWTRVLVPSYYCEDVVRTIACTQSVPVARYPCGPLDPAIHVDARPRDVVLRMDYFGWGMAPLEEEGRVAVIEDRSHAPLCHPSDRARFAFASLRKTLPLPDGGCLWVDDAAPPQLPDRCTTHDEAVRLRLAAMVLKRRYLLGGAGSKQTFRALEGASEELLRKGEGSDISRYSLALLRWLDVDAMQRIRQRNYSHLSARLGSHPLLEVLGPRDCAAPIGLILRTATAQLRERLRVGLLARRVYPAVLWPIAEPPEPWLRPEDVDFSMRTLALHVDSRYSERDMELAADAISDVLQSEPCEELA
jgi:hypothetical protein